MTNWMLRALLVGMCLCLPTAVADDESKCEGGFDVFFLFDRSSSTLDNFPKHMVPFAKAVSAHFVSPRVQTSLIWFGTKGHLALPLTNDLDRVQRTLSKMGRAPAIREVQGTNIGAGLDLVETQDTTTNKIVFIISDGCDNDLYKPNTRRRVKELKALGVEIYIIYLPSGGSVQCPAYLKNIASAPIESHYIPILEPPYYDMLNTPEFITGLLQKSCLQIDSVSPESICNSTRRTVTVKGKGFTLTDDLSKFTCRFEVPPCEDDDTWMDQNRNKCSAYGLKPEYCAQSKTAREMCPQTCGLCADRSAFCQDDPRYLADCPKWEAVGECDLTPDFMLTHCQKSCKRCGEVKAVVIHDTEIKCQSPPLGLVSDFSFEVTRNGITWTSGDVKISSFDCGGSEVDDLPIMDGMKRSLVLEVINPPTYGVTSPYVDVRFMVTNDGDVALNGPIGVFSQGFDNGVACDHGGVLGSGVSMVCTGRRSITRQDRATGQFGTIAYASVQVSDAIVIESPMINSTFYMQGVPTPLPTVRPTTTPTMNPTPRPTRDPTPLPTTNPTAPPTPEPTVDQQPPLATGIASGGVNAGGSNDGDGSSLDGVEMTSDSSSVDGGSSSSDLASGDDSFDSVGAGGSVDVSGGSADGSGDGVDAGDGGEDTGVGGIASSLDGERRGGDGSDDVDGGNNSDDVDGGNNSDDTNPDGLDDLFNDLISSASGEDDFEAGDGGSGGSAGNSADNSGDGSGDNSADNSGDGSGDNSPDNSGDGSGDNSGDISFGSSDDVGGYGSSDSGSSGDGMTEFGAGTGVGNADGSRNGAGSSDGTSSDGEGPNEAGPPPISPDADAGLPNLAAKSNVVGTCETWYKPIGCIPWWVWVIAGVTVALILAAIIFACVKSRDEKVPAGDVAAMQQLNAEAVPAEAVPPPKAAVPPPLPPGYGAGRPQPPLPENDNHIRYHYNDATL